MNICSQLRRASVLCAAFVASLPACVGPEHLMAASSNSSKFPAPQKATVQRSDAQAQQSAQLEFCGSQLASNEVREFAQIVASTLRDNFSPRKQRLFAEVITLVDAGKVAHVERAELSRYVGKLPSAEDWQIISTRLNAGELYPVGWRGCILANGKSTFVADESGRLGLSSFDFDRGWE